MEKVENLQNHMGNGNTEVDIVRKNWKKMLEIKKKCNKNTFSGFMFKSDMGEKRISKFEENQIQNFLNWNKKRIKNKGIGHPRAVG